MTPNPQIRRMLLVTLVVLALWGSKEAAAQTIGTFQWRTAPYCNLLTLTVIQQGAVYQLAGTDNLCGAGVAPVTGTAVVAGAGVAFGVAVALPSGRTAHLSATVSLTDLSGTWTDADANSGAFLFGAPGAGSPRPAPAGAAAITSTQLSSTIFGGTGSATTISRSDHVHDDRYYTEAETEARIAAATEVLSGPGISVPAVLSAQGSFSSINEVVTTSAPGHLLITKFAQVIQNCTSGARFYYLTVDGVPLRSSTAYRVDGTLFSGTLAGVTATAVAAGLHTIGVAGECLARANYPGFGNVTYVVSTSGVVVLP